MPRKLLKTRTKYFDINFSSSYSLTKALSYPSLLKTRLLIFWKRCCRRVLFVSNHGKLNLLKILISRFARRKNQWKHEEIFKAENLLWMPERGFRFWSNPARLLSPPVGSAFRGGSNTETLFVKMAIPWHA